MEEKKTELSPSEVLARVDACVICDACAEACSIFQVVKSRSPADKLAILRLLAQGTNITKQEQEALFTCTKCEACQAACPLHLPLIALFDWGRNQIVTRYGFINDRQKTVIENIVRSGNPFNEKNKGTTGLSCPPAGQGATTSGRSHRESRTLLYLGCMLRHRITQMATDLLDIFDALDVDVTLDENESCCGYYVWNCGDHDTANAIIKKNMEYMEKYDEILCACAGCYTFLRSNYPGSARVVHVIEKIAEKLPSFLEEHRDVSPGVARDGAGEKRVLFHDSCHLARPWGVIEPPRDAFSMLGYEVVEFDKNREHTCCCGANGGMRFTNKELAILIGKERLKEASIKMGALFTLCPFCIFNFKEASAPTNDIKIESMYALLKNDIILISERKGT